MLLQGVLGLLLCQELFLPQKESDNMFIDETVIEVQAGNGGTGGYAYAREKFKPKGKPSGGNGGRGAHIIFVASDKVQTLQDVSYRRFYKAERGGNGEAGNRYGRKGEDVFLKVPLGTVVRDDETGEILHDLTELGEEVIIAKGGRGGRGNKALVSRFNPAPEHSEDGKDGEYFKLRLTLKVMADVGLVGKPNAGKSTLLSTVSRATPKVADYPFTTLTPNLGIIKLEGGYDSFVMADIPGLIEGAHDGKGLGIRFLKHIERTRILAVMVSAEEENPEEEAEKLVQELASYSPFLAEKPRIYVMTKTDLLEDDSDKTVPKGWFSICSLLNEGVKELMIEMGKMVQKTRDADIEGEKPTISVG